MLILNVMIKNLYFSTKNQYTFIVIIGVLGKGLGKRKPGGDSGKF